MNFILANRKRFQNNIFGFEESNVVFIGVPIFSIGKKILEKLREASWYVEPFNTLKNARIFDAGNFDMIKVGEYVKKIMEMKKIPCIFSNSHLTSYYVLKAINKNVNILIFDAHLDLKDKYKDEKIYGNEKLNDATWLRRCLEENLVSKIKIFGARSFDEDEYNFAKQKKIEIIKKQKKLKLKNLYISFDFDVYDPSILKSTEYPEPDGKKFSDIKKFLKNCKLDIIAMDFSLMNFSSIPELYEYFLMVKTIFELIHKINLWQ